MTFTVAPNTITRLCGLARDNGFDLEHGRDGGWLAFASTHTRLRLWLSAVGEQVYMVAVSQQNVALALADRGAPLASPLPTGSHGAVTVTTVEDLRSVVRRAYQLANALPDELLHAYQDQTRNLPTSTEAERLAVQRVGQDLFRDGLLRYWEERCAVTGLAVPELLRASHIKPWAECESDAERLDVFNGLLLAPHLDAAFDRGFVTVADDGTVVASHALDASARELLGVHVGLRLHGLAEGHRRYLPWHRARVFRAAITK